MYHLLQHLKAQHYAHRVYSCVSCRSHNQYINSINLLVLVVEMEFALCDIENKLLYVIYINFSLQSVNRLQEHVPYVRI